MNKISQKYRNYNHCNACSGASKHISGNSSSFHKLRNIEHKHNVTIPNGQVFTFKECSIMYPNTYHQVNIKKNY